MIQTPSAQYTWVSDCNNEVWSKTDGAFSVVADCAQHSNVVSLYVPSATAFGYTFAAKAGAILATVPAAAVAAQSRSLMERSDNQARTQLAIRAITVSFVAQIVTLLRSVCQD